MKNKKFALTALLMLLLCLLPVMTSEAKAELRETTCIKCNATAYLQVLEYVAKRDGYDDSEMHWVRLECYNCGYEMLVTTGGKDEHSHNGEKVSCTVGLDKCDACGKSPVPALGHDWSEWKRVEGSEQHTRSCNRTRCELKETENCSGGTATCTKKAVCEKCGQPYGSIDPNNHDLEHHDAKAVTCTENGWDAYDTCKDCDYVSEHKEYTATGHAIVKHDAKAPTCTEIGWDAYETCENCDYTTYKEIAAALDHDYETSSVKPTCFENGYTLHTCTRCGDQYSDSEVQKLHHWFNEWAPNADGTHSALCKRDGCGYTSNIECAPVSCILKLEENDYACALCPICGEISKNDGLARVENAEAFTVNKESVLPKGELTVRMGALENDEMVMSIVFEISGRATQPIGKIRIALPAEMLKGYALAVLNAEGTESALEAESEGDAVSFVLSFAEGTPAKLIHLLPAA